MWQTEADSRQASLGRSINFEAPDLILPVHKCKIHVGKTRVHPLEFNLNYSRLHKPEQIGLYLDLLEERVSDIDGRQVRLWKVSVVCQTLLAPHGVCDLFALVIQPCLLNNLLLAVILYERNLHGIFKS